MIDVLAFALEYDKGVGRFLISPGFGGAAAVAAALVALTTARSKIRADRTDNDKRITATREDLDRKIAAEREDSDRKLMAAREEAIRTRRAEAYVQVLETVGRIGHWAERVRPGLDTVPLQPDPELPDLAQQAASQARLQVFGTQPVQELWRAWDKRVRAVDVAVRQIARADREGATGPAKLRAIQFVNDLEDVLRPAEQEARRVLGQQMNRELAESLPPPTRSIATS